MESPQLISTPSDVQLTTVSTSFVNHTYNTMAPGITAITSASRE